MEQSVRDPVMRERKYMKKKPMFFFIFVFFCSMLIMLSPQSTSFLITNVTAEKIDQIQDKSDGSKLINSKAWQQFVPTVKTLVRVEVKIRAIAGETSPITLSIEQPVGTILASRELSSSSIPTTADWVSFDISDVKLTTGVKYYIVLSTSSTSHYYWSGSGLNPYVNGISSIGASWDFCFKTYVNTKKSTFIEYLDLESRMMPFSIFFFIVNSFKTMR